MAILGQSAKRWILAGALLVAWLASKRGGGAELSAVDAGRVGVIVLATPEDAAELVGLSATIQRVLESDGNAQVLPAKEALLRLGDGSTIPASDVDFDRLQGLFQQGYLQSYSFEYEAAVATINRVLAGLDHLVPGEARWELFVRASIFRGIALAGLRDEEGCLRAFAAILRTRPDHRLSREQYSSKTIQLWERARSRLSALPHGKLAVESEPSGAGVYLDGVEVGRTPFIGEFYHGRYHLYVQQSGTDGVARWIEIGQDPVRVRLQLSFESSLNLGHELPVVRLPTAGSRLPPHWWPWLGARLGLQRLIVVSRSSQDGRKHLVATLVDLVRSRPIREAWLLAGGNSAAELERDARDLVAFLNTGEAAGRLRVTPLPEDPEVGPDDGVLVPPLPITFKPRPWHRRWWPYGLGGAACLATGVAAHLTADYHERAARKTLTVGAEKHEMAVADTWLGVAVSGYVVAGAAILTGVILDLAYKPEEIDPASSRLIPVAGNGSIGLQWFSRF